MEEEQLETAIFGKRVEDFLASDIGKYLQTKIDEEIDSALNALKVVLHTDASLIQTLQNKVYRAESIRNWLIEALLRGQQALALMEGEDGG